MGLTIRVDHDDHKDVGSDRRAPRLFGLKCTNASSILGNSLRLLVLLSVR